MTKFATTTEAYNKALSIVDAQIKNIDVNEQLELYLELINRAATIQQAIGVTLSGDVTIDNVGITSSVLPTGASTSDLQASVQADAGTDASKAISIQGVTNGKAIPVNLSGALPAGTNEIGAITNTSFGISGTLPAFAATPTFNIGTAPTLTFSNTSFTANAGTNLNTSLLALESGGNLAGINGKLPTSVGAKASTGSLSVTQAYAATSTLANVSAATSSTTLLNANNARKTVVIVNDSTATLYINLNASVASTTNYSILLPPISSGIPSQLILKGEDYSGEIRGIWSAVNGAARITEVV